MSWLCVITAETLTGLTTEREANASMKIESSSLEAWRQGRKHNLALAAGILRLPALPAHGGKNGGYFWFDFLGVFRQDLLLIHLGGGFKWSCPELRICPILYIYCLIPGKGKSPTVFLPNNSVKGKISSPSVTENSLLLRSPTLPAFTKDHLTDPGSETVPLIHSKQGHFWLKRGRAAQPRLVPSYRAQRAKEKQEVEVRLWCWESLQHVRLSESSWWAGLSWETQKTQNQCHMLESFRPPTHREMGNNRSKHSHFQAGKAQTTAGSWPSLQL